MPQVLKLRPDSRARLGIPDHSENEEERFHKAPSGKPAVLTSSTTFKYPENRRALISWIDARSVAHRIERDDTAHFFR
jgi:hypothetical protein